jgi:DNA invertase Pin-like site-specific DNA recombinase
LKGDVERLLYEGLAVHPLRLVAAAMGVSVATASRRLRSMGLKRGRGGARAHPFEEKRRAEIERVLRAAPGVTKTAIAKLFGVSRQTVHRVAKGMKQKQEG